MHSVYGGLAESVASQGRSEAEEAAPLDPGVLGMPPSWVPKLQIGRDILDMRCPRGVKAVLYKRCQHEIFALFGECSRWDGIVERLTLYEVPCTPLRLPLLHIMYNLHWMTEHAGMTISYLCVMCFAIAAGKPKLVPLHILLY